MTFKHFSLDQLLAELERQHEGTVCAKVDLSVLNSDGQRFVMLSIDVAQMQVLSMHNLPIKGYSEIEQTLIKSGYTVDNLNDEVSLVSQKNASAANSSRPDFFSPPRPVASRRSAWSQGGAFFDAAAASQAKNAALRSEDVCAAHLSDSISRLQQSNTYDQ